MFHANKLIELFLKLQFVKNLQGLDKFLPDCKDICYDNFNEKFATQIVK